jgi:radical SAM superfamily enzyme YgiQ (UPF0313 family)
MEHGLLFDNYEEVFKKNNIGVFMKVAILIPPSKHARNVARDLVYGCWCKGKRIAGIQFPPLSLISVATVLKIKGFHVDLVDAAALLMTIDELKEKIVDYNVVVMLTSTMTLNEDAGVMEELKRSNKSLKTIVFGGHVTAEPESTLARPGIDIVVRREAEYIISELIESLEQGKEKWKEIKGICFRENGNIIRNSDYSLIRNLDELPIPDRSLLPNNVDYFNPIVKRTPYTTMFTTRGCPGLCTFCSSPTFYGSKVRMRSSDNVLKELCEIIKLGYKEVFFRDEIFTFSKKRVLEICKGIIDNGFDITWICSARIGSVDKEMMWMMKKAGCHMLRLGVETGVQRLLDNVMKGIQLEETRQTFEWAKETGLDTHAHMMIGLPTETKEDIEETFKFVREIDPTILTFGIMTVYPGTPLFKEINEQNWELSNRIGDGTQQDLSKLHTNSFYNEFFTTLTQQEMSGSIRKIYRHFYLRPGYVIKWLKRMKTIDEFKRVSLAGTQVLEFVFGKD